MTIMNGSLDSYEQASSMQHPAVVGYLSDTCRFGRSADGYQKVLLLKLLEQDIKCRYVGGRSQSCVAIRR